MELGKTEDLLKHDSEKPVFCYVVAYKDENGDLAFDHLFVRSMDCDEAYVVGGNAIGEVKNMVNDYAFEVQYGQWGPQK